MTTHSLILQEINSVKYHNGLAPRANRALQAFVAASALLTGFLGIETVTKAVVAFRTDLDDALIVLKTHNHKNLVADVLVGCVTLSATAKLIRGEVKLVETFNKASFADCAALGHAVGPVTVFDDVVVPSL